MYAGLGYDPNVIINEYRTFLNRDPESQDVIAGWGTALDQHDKTWLDQQFVNSAEYQAKHPPAAAAAITPGPAAAAAPAAARAPAPAPSNYFSIALPSWQGVTLPPLASWPVWVYVAIAGGAWFLLRTR